MKKCSTRIVRAKVKNQPDISGKFWLVKRGKVLLFSAKTKKDAIKKAFEYKKECEIFN